MDKQLVYRFAEIKLIPFYLTGSIFLIVCQPHLDYPPETVLSAILKILPILSLAGFVFIKFNDKTRSDGIYSNFILYGLLVSTLGDICLVWRQTLFLPGVLFFAIAHLFYILAFVTKYKASKHTALFCYLTMASFLFVSEGIESVIMKGSVLVYSSLISTMTFLAAAHYENELNVPSKLGALGGTLFMISDFILALDRWRFAILGSEFLVMVTYYSAQACLALSILD